MTKEQFISEIKDLQKPLRRFLLVLCNDDGFTADDIAQDACVKAWLYFDNFKGKSKLSTWLFKIAYNCWYDRKYVHSGEDSIDCTGTKSTFDIQDTYQPDDKFQYQNLYQAIAGLNKNEKAAILLFYMEDKPIKEIAVIMGVREGTVKSLLSRGRNNLKIKIANNE